MNDAERDAARALDPPAKIDGISDADVPPELAWPFVEKDGTRGRLIVAMTGAGFDLWRTEDLERFVATFRGLDLGSDLVVGGNAFVQHDIVQSVNRDGPRASLIAAIGAAVVVVLIRQTLLVASAIDEQRLARISQSKVLDNLDIDIPVLAAPQRFVEPDPVEDVTPRCKATGATEQVALSEMMAGCPRDILRPHLPGLANAISADAGVRFAQQSNLFVQFVRQPFVVVVEKGDDLAAGVVDAPVP
jgi:hypothetical protein